MAFASRFLAGFLALFLAIGDSNALHSSQIPNPSLPRAISDLKEAIVRGLGSQAEGLEISGFDARDVLVGQSVAYEFHVEIDNRVVPIKLLEDLSRWEFVDLPIFRAAEEEEEENGLAEMGKAAEGSRVQPVLAPFQLAGPMELWIQDGDDMRLALPHDVDAGILKKVVLSDGAVVTVKGARSVSLQHPLELPLPLNRTHQGHRVASGLLTLAEVLRHTSRSNEKPLLSLRIVSPTSLTSSSSSVSPNDRLKLKRLAPGLVELSSPSTLALSERAEEGSSAPTMWPLTSLNGSESNLRGFEDLLASVLGEKGREEGSFRLVKAEVSARTYVKLGFAMEKPIKDGEVDWSVFPSWRTRPEKLTSHFEVLARVEDNGKVVPERIAEVQPFKVQDTVLESVQTGNVTMSKLPIYHPPPVYFTL